MFANAINKWWLRKQTFYDLWGSTKIQFIEKQEFGDKKKGQYLLSTLTILSTET